MSALEVSVPYVTKSQPAEWKVTQTTTTLPSATAQSTATGLGALKSFFEAVKEVVKADLEDSLTAADIPPDAGPVKAIEHWVKEGDTGKDAVAVNNMLVALGKIEMDHGKAPQIFDKKSADAVEEIQRQYAVNIQTLEVVLWNQESMNEPNVYKLDEDRIAGQYTRYVLKHLLVKGGLLDDEEFTIPREALVRTLSNKRLVVAGLEKASGNEAEAITISSQMLSSSGVTPVAANMPAAPVTPAASPSAPTTPDTTQNKANELDLAVIAAVTGSKNLTEPQKTDLNGIVDNKKLTVTPEGKGYIVAIPKIVVRDENKASKVANEILEKINSLDTSKKLKITSEQRLNSDETLWLYSIQEPTDTDQSQE